MKRRLASGRTSLRGFKKKCVNQVGKGTQLVPACPCLPRFIGDSSRIYRGSIGSVKRCLTVYNTPDLSGIYQGIYTNA